VRLIIFPEIPGVRNGSQIAVASDIARFANLEQDCVVCYSDHMVGGKDYLYLRRMRHERFRHVLNLLRSRPASEVFAYELDSVIPLGRESFGEIFCGETIFYRALRYLFPEVHLHVRFHNFYSFAKYRQDQRRFPSTFRMSYLLNKMTELESEILRDKNVSPIFITEEELSFARLAFPSLGGVCWPVVPPLILTGPIKPPSKLRLVHFGSASAAHTEVGLRFFCSVIFPRIIKDLPGIEFHLFGNGSKSFTAPSKGIYGHGIFQDDSFPFNGEALFIVPDLFGCGIKLKIHDLLRAQVPFITTPFGISGYKIEGNENILICDVDDWHENIINYFSRFAFYANKST
jgi:hypothetical protein